MNEPLFDFGVNPDEGVPRFLSTDPDDVRHALSTKEGWRQFVGTLPKRPTVRERLHELSAAELSEFQRARIEFHSATILVKHTQLLAAWQRMQEIVMGAWAEDGPGMGIAVSGGPGFGKTALTTGFSRNYEIALRRDCPAAFNQEREFIPIVYSSLLRDSGLKAQMEHILGFYGVPCSRNDRESDLLTRLCNTINACKTKVLILDQAQNLRSGVKTDEKVAASLKEIMDRTQVVLLMCGIDIANSGPLAVSRGGGRYDQDQLATRFAYINISRVRKGSDEWLNLLAGIEKTLVLTKARPGDLHRVLADELWELSQGAIGVAFNIVRVAANSAILGGEERITATVLRRTARTIMAASKAKAAA